MGYLHYACEGRPVRIPDDVLAHLKAVTVTKLRRSESFTLSWRHPDDQPRGRSTIWLHPAIPLRFVFDDPEPAQLSREWIEELATSANSSGGIMLVAEHFDTGAMPVQEQANGDLALGTVQVENLAIDTLTVADTDVAVRADD